jgi:3-oxoacyl-(acyl-carrier-protein) synthase
MSMGVYVRDAVVYCTLGSSEEEILSSLHNPKKASLQSFRFGKEQRERPYGAMNEHKVVGYEEFFERLSSVLREVIEKSNLSEEELEECPLLIGSTSMNIPCSEALYQQTPQEMLPSIGYGRIGETLANTCGIGGEVCLFISACTSSASALLYAERGIQSGRFKRAIVLGFEFYNEFTMSGFEALGLLDDAGSRSFDKERMGMMLGEGCSAIVLDSSVPNKLLEFSLLGGENRCDLFSPTSHNPNGEIVAQTIEDALLDAGIASTEVSLIKAHATGSNSNDMAEGKGLNRVFANMPPVLTLKPLVGHTLGGCGAIELAVLWFALKSGFIPKSFGFSTVDEEFGIIPTRTEVESSSGIVLMNHFGFGGNGTVLVARYGRGE